MKTKQLIMCAMFAALTAAGSLIKIPIPGTPMLFTLQTLFVFMAGLMLEPKYALFSQLTYAAMGLIGIPIFSEGGGVGYLLRPSFGFIIGFCLCALLISLTVRKDLIILVSGNSKKLTQIIKIIVFMLISVTAMYVIGVIYMYLIYNLYLNEPKSIEFVIVSASGIFFFLDIAKFIFAIPLCAAIYRRLKTLFLS